MTVSKARELFRLLTKEFFAEHTVVFTNQSRVAKPKIPLVTIAVGNVKRHRSANEIYDSDETEGYYHTKLPITIDLYTHGKPVIDDESGEEVAREDTSVDEMLLYADFLNSQYVTLWCNKHNVAVVIDGDVLGLTGIVNDTTYEFRSRLSVNMYFTHETLGEKATHAAL